MSDIFMKPLLIGQAPSRESDGRSAFSTNGKSSSRLRRLIGRPVLNAFDAVNLIDRWPGSASIKGDLFPIVDARKAARKLMTRDPHGVFVLVGKSVARAFGVRLDYFRWVEMDGRLLVTIPHPSGVSRWWNDPANERRAARFLRSLVGGDRG